MLLARSCGLGRDVGGVIQSVGSPLPFGPQDMAVGVRKDMLPVTIGLSYWFQELRGCNPTTSGSPCYNELNMEQIFNKWHNVVTCPTSKSGAGSIDYENFLYVFIICWAGAACAFLWEVCQLRFQDRMVSLFIGDGLWNCVTTEPFNVLNPKTGVLSMNRLHKAFKESFIKACQGGNPLWSRVVSALCPCRHSPTRLKALGCVVACPFSPWAAEPVGLGTCLRAYKGKITLPLYQMWCRTTRCCAASAATTLGLTLARGRPVSRLEPDALAARVAPRQQPSGP